MVNSVLSIFNLRVMVGHSREHTVGTWRYGMVAQKSTHGSRFG